MILKKCEIPVIIIKLYYGFCLRVYNVMGFTRAYFHLPVQYLFLGPGCLTGFDCIKRYLRPPKLLSPFGCPPPSFIEFMSMPFMLVFSGCHMFTGHHTKYLVLQPASGFVCLKFVLNDCIHCM